MGKKKLYDLSEIKEDELQDLFEKNQSRQGDLNIRIKRELKLRKQIEVLSNPNVYIEQNTGTKQKLSPKKLLIRIALVCSILSIFSYFIFRNPNAQYTKVTAGTIHEVVELKSFFQGFEGINNLTIGYQVIYTYSVDGVNYGGQAFLANSAKNKMRIKTINKNLGDNIFLIRYKLGEPNKSRLDINRINTTKI
jgi:hypothetical protein